MKSNDLLRIFKVAAIGTVVVCAIVITDKITTTLDSITETVKAYESVPGQIKDSLLKVNNVADKISETVETVNSAAIEQRANWQKTSVETAKTARDIRQFVARLDRQLVDKTLPNFDSAVVETKQTISKLGSSADAVTIAAESLNVQVSNPAISDSLKNLSEGTKQLALASGHANNILGSGERTASYYEKKLTTPASFFKNLIGTIFSWGSEARILLGY